jgi:nitroreductase
VTPPPASHEQISALIRHRRSIKPTDLDSQRPVDQGLLLHILEDATWAPNHGLTEPWLFHSFTSLASRQKLATDLQEAYRLSTAPAEFRQDKFQKMGEFPLLAPAIIACILDPKGGSKIPLQEEIQAHACALQNLQLSATAAGLGCYWSSPPVLDSAAFHQSLSLLPQQRCLGLIYLGWPKAPFTWPKSSRSPIQEKVHWH